MENKRELIAVVELVVRQSNSILGKVPTRRKINQIVYLSKELLLILITCFTSSPPSLKKEMMQETLLQ